MSVQSAIDYTLQWNDGKMEGKVTKEKGNKSRFGLAQRLHPDLTDENFYSLSREEALDKARSIYEKDYAPHMSLDALKDERVQAKALDMFVDMGVWGIKLFQRACGVPEDGYIGPFAILRANSSSPDALLFRLCNLSKAFYALQIGSDDDRKTWAQRAICPGAHGQTLVIP